MRSTQEQLFIAGGGLLGHLVKEITSDGVWCAGSLQTAFDLLGELCKGNREVWERFFLCNGLPCRMFHLSRRVRLSRAMPTRSNAYIKASLPAVDILFCKPPPSEMMAATLVGDTICLGCSILINCGYWVSVTWCHIVLTKKTAVTRHVEYQARLEMAKTGRSHQEAATYADFPFSPRVPLNCAEHVHRRILCL